MTADMILKNSAHWVVHSGLALNAVQRILCVKSPNFPPKALVKPEQKALPATIAGLVMAGIVVVVIKVMPI